MPSIIEHINQTEKSGRQFLSQRHRVLLKINRPKFISPWLLNESSLHSLLRCNVFLIDARIRNSLNINHSTNVVLTINRELLFIIRTIPL